MKILIRILPSANKQNGLSFGQAILKREEALMLMGVLASFAKILFRFLVEGFLAAKRAEVVGLAFVFGLASGSRGVNVHSADGIMYCSCHRLSPFVGFDYHINRPLH
jgi:hypothetical protein